MRFTVRRMMVIVAVTGLLLTVVPPWWRYWFGSPWRVMTIPEYTESVGEHEVHLTDAEFFFDTRKPADAVRLQAMMSDAQSKSYPFKVERFATFPRSRFPTLSDAEVLRIDPSEPAR